MKIELRNIQYAAFASEETYCYTASVYVDGKKRGTANNDGHGGMTLVSPPELRAELDAYGATLPQESLGIINGEEAFFTQDAESLCDAEVTKWLHRKDFQRVIKSRLVYIHEDGNLYTTKTMSAARLAAVLESLRNKRITPPKGAVEILNLMDNDRAFNIYLQSAA